MRPAAGRAGNCPGGSGGCQCAVRDHLGRFYSSPQLVDLYAVSMSLGICLRNVLQCRPSWFSRVFAISERSAGIALRELRVRPLRRWAASRQGPGGALALDGTPDERTGHPAGVPPSLFLGWPMPPKFVLAIPFGNGRNFGLHPLYFKLAVGTKTHKVQGLLVGLAVDQNDIGVEMAISAIAPLTVKRMVLITFRQGGIRSEQGYCVLQCGFNSLAAAALPCPFEVALIRHWSI